MKPAEWNETCSLAPANHEAGPEQQSETDLLRAHVAMLEEELRDLTVVVACGASEDFAPLVKARAALSGSSDEWLEGVKREAAAMENDRWAEAWWNVPDHEEITSEDFKRRAAELKEGK